MLETLTYLLGLILLPNDTQPLVLDLPPRDKWIKFTRLPIAILQIFEVTTMSLQRFFFSRLNIPVPINWSLLTGACGLHPVHRCVLFGLGCLKNTE